MQHPKSTDRLYGKVLCYCLILIGSVYNDKPSITAELILL